VETRAFADVGGRCRRQFYSDIVVLDVWVQCLILFQGFLSSSRDLIQ
jgi:hypothetical protein